MDLVPLHPMLVHLPLALGVLMPVVTAGLLAAWWRGLLPRRAWWGAVLLQGALVLSGVAALRSGEAEEERVEAVVPESAIEAHEDAATGFVVASAVVLVLAIGVSLLRDEPTARNAAAVVTAGTLAVLYLGFRTGHAGGDLVYEHGAGAAYATEGAAGPGGGHGDDDDDD